MSEWNPKLYLDFEEYRTRPVRDLVSSIEYEEPDFILDIGCGPGNSTRVHKDRWPDAKVFGIDSSEAMIIKARELHDDIDFAQRDATQDISDLGLFDIISTSAALQWMPDLPRLLKDLYSMLKPGGVFAAQVPNANGLHIQDAVDTVVRKGKWKKHLLWFDSRANMYEPGEYYDMLCGLPGSVKLWETWHFQIMPDHRSMIEMYSATGMKPYVTRLDEEQREQFFNDILQIIEKKYPIQNDGNVLYPFRRIFFTIQKDV